MSSTIRRSILLQIDRPVPCTCVAGARVVVVQDLHRKAEDPSRRAQREELLALAAGVEALDVGGTCAECSDVNGRRTGVVPGTVNVVVAGTFVRGYPATGPSHSCGGEPGMPDHFEDLRARVPGTASEVELTEKEFELAEELLLEGLR